MVRGQPKKKLTHIGHWPVGKLDNFAFNLNNETNVPGKNLGAQWWLKFCVPWFISISESRFEKKGWAAAKGWHHAWFDVLLVGKTKSWCCYDALLKQGHVTVVCLLQDSKAEACYSFECCGARMRRLECVFRGYNLLPCYTVVHMLQTCESEAC